MIAVEIEGEMITIQDTDNENSSLSLYITEILSISLRNLASNAILIDVNERKEVSDERFSYLDKASDRRKRLPGIFELIFPSAIKAVVQAFWDRYRILGVA